MKILFCWLQHLKALRKPVRSWYLVFTVSISSSLYRLMRYAQADIKTYIHKCLKTQATEKIDIIQITPSNSQIFPHLAPIEQSTWAVGLSHCYQNIVTWIWNLQSWSCNEGRMTFFFFNYSLVEIKGYIVSNHSLLLSPFFVSVASYKKSRANFILHLSNHSISLPCALPSPYPFLHFQNESPS